MGNGGSNKWGPVLEDRNLFCCSLAATTAVEGYMNVFAEFLKAVVSAEMMARRCCRHSWMSSYETGLSHLRLDPALMDVLL